MAQWRGHLMDPVRIGLVDWSRRKSQAFRVDLSPRSLPHISLAESPLIPRKNQLLPSDRLPRFRAAFISNPQVVARVWGSFVRDWWGLLYGFLVSYPLTGGQGPEIPHRGRANLVPQKPSTHNLFNPAPRTVD